MLVVSPFSLRSHVMTALFGLALASAASAQSPLCVQGPLPENPDNRLLLCSPDPDSVDVQILSEGLRMTWNVPPRAQASYVSPILAQRWLGADSLGAIPGAELRGTYLNVIDRRIELTVQTIDSLGTGRGSAGVLGRDHIIIAWDSKYEASSTRAIAGVLDLPADYADNKGLRFDVKASDPQAPPDTTTVAGIRIAFRAGTELRRLDAAFFDVEDFEGWHVWRWGADPTSPNYLAV